MLSPGLAALVALPLQLLLLLLLLLPKLNLTVEVMPVLLILWIKANQAATAIQT